MISRVVPPLLALLLAACSSSSATTTAGQDGPVDAVRVAMPASSGGQALPERPKDAKGSWFATPDGSSARFGYPGETALISLECHGGSLVVTRNIAAPVGAAALFALQGSGYILRLPVDATALPGQPGYVWQGSVPADDKRLTLFKARFAGTLPGGGHIEVPASDVPGALVKRCAAEAPKS